MNRKKVVTTFAAFCALAARPAPAVSVGGEEVAGWVARPYAAVGEKWEKCHRKGKDFWLLFEENFLDLPGVSEQPFVAESGTARVQFNMQAECRFFRTLSIAEATLSDTENRPVKGSVSLSAEEDGAFTVGNGNLTDGNKATFCVLSSDVRDLGRRYLPARATLRVSAPQPFSRVRILSGTRNGGCVAGVKNASRPAEVSVKGGVCEIALAEGTTAFTCQLVSAPLRYVCSGIRGEDRLGPRLACAPWYSFLRVGRWDWPSAPKDFVDVSALAGIGAKYDETYLGSEDGEWDANFLQKLNHSPGNNEFFLDLQYDMKLPCSRDELIANLSKRWEQLRNLNGPRYFSVSGGLNFMPVACDGGAVLAALEQSGERRGLSHRLSLMYMLGASRQFNVPTLHNTAYYAGGSTADSRPMYKLSKDGKLGTDFGQAPSLSRRNFYIFYYMGGNYLDFESQPAGQTELDENGKTYHLTENGKAIRDIFEWTRNPEGVRGDWYAPVLLLADRTYGDDQARPMWTRRSAFYGLYPAEDADIMNEYVMRSISPLEGALTRFTDPSTCGCLDNSPLGDIFAFHMSNPLKHGEIHLEQLLRYPVTVLPGRFVWSESLANRLKAYVGAGGTLVLTTAQAGPYLNDPGFLGAEVSEKTFEEDGLVLNRVQPAPGARVLMKTTGGAPLVVAKRYGAGQVDLIASPYLRRAESVAQDPKKAVEKYLPHNQIKTILAEIQKAVLPVRAEGDCEAVYNLAPDGTWRVLVVNNRGISKNPGSSVEEHFPEYTADVTLHLPKGAVSEEVRSGARPAKTVETAAGMEVTFKVPPAGVFVFKLAGVKIPQAPAPKAVFEPVKGFTAARAAASKRPNDGYLYDPADFRYPEKTPELIGEWKGANGMKDSSGHGHDLKLEGCMCADGVMKCGTGHSYAHTAFKVEYPVHEGTVEAWVKPSADKKAFFSGGSREHQGGVFNIAGERLMVLYSDGRWQASHLVENRRADIVGPEAKPEWTHLALTFKDAVLRFYVNGEEVKGPDGPIRQTFPHGVNSFQNHLAVTVGSLAPQWGYHFRGEIDAVRYFGRWMDDDGIRARWKAGR